MKPSGAAPGSNDVDTGPVPPQMFAHPIDRAPQPLLQTDRGRPAEQLAGAAAVSQEAPALALRRSEPLRIALHPHRPAGELPDELNQVADADFAAAAEVDRLADGGRLGPGPHETVHRVGDEIQV